MKQYFSQIQQFFQTNTFKLALTYFVIIMTLTGGFSVIIYKISSVHLEKPFEQGWQEIDERKQFQRFFKERSSLAKAELIKSLVSLNIAVLTLGAWVSWLMARRTLYPIEQAMNYQARFVSDASHELRTPLASLRITNEIAERRKAFTTEQAKQLARQNIEQAIKLQNLTDALFQLANIGQVQQNIKQADLTKIINSAVEIITPSAHQKQITINSNQPKIRLRTNPQLIEQLLKILLENAVKYSAKNTSITITATKRPHDVRISVIDQGIGIKKTDLEHIFERFYQVDNARCKSSQTGHGLGLSIAKAISDQLDLNLSVKSQLGRGTEFSFCLKR